MVTADIVGYVMDIINVDRVDDYFHGAVALYSNFNSNKEVANP
jgi:hypothetical protein